MLIILNCSREGDKQVKRSAFAFKEVIRGTIMVNLYSFNLNLSFCALISDDN
jgi:hypothetical protein